MDFVDLGGFEQIRVDLGWFGWIWVDLGGVGCSSLELDGFEWILERISVHLGCVDLD